MKNRIQNIVCFTIILFSVFSYSQKTEKKLITPKVSVNNVEPKSPILNPTKALAFYKKLIAEGNTRAMIGLGNMYLNGWGIPKNIKEAEKWYTTAANKGNPEALFILGRIYKDPKNKSYNPKKALQFFEKAALSGFTSAWGQLGYMTMSGQGTEVNFEKAFTIFLKGEKVNDVQSIYGLGYMLYKGLGCKQDYKLAVSKFIHGTTRRYSPSMYMLGLCYRNGYGVQVDEETGKMWLNQAASLGHEDAEKELKKATPENISLNQSLVENLNKKNIKIEIPKSFQIVNHKINEEISGLYDGILVQYDYSGKNIISSTAFTILINQEDQDITGEWNEISGEKSLITATINHDALVFHNSKIYRKDHYNNEKPIEYDLKELKLQESQNKPSQFLIGNLLLTNSKSKEPERPMNLILEKRS